MKDNRQRLRCPACRSTNLYKRSWSTVCPSTQKEKCKKKKNDIKRYRCIFCKNEFDNPLTE